MGANFSKEYSDSIFMVELKMEAVFSSETLVTTYQTGLQYKEVYHSMSLRNICNHLIG
jgi:hypothetical protein